MRVKHPAAALAGLLSSALLAIGCTSAPAMASTPVDIDDLKALIKKGGTEIVYIDCKDKSTAGKYSYSKKKKIDRLTICKDSFDPKDTDTHWEVLAHEATHIMQRCNGGTLLVAEHHPRVWRRLKAKAPHYAELLQERYRDADQIHEAEAFVMELQSPEMVKEWFVDYCLTPKKPAAPAPGHDPGVDRQRQHPHLRPEAWSGRHPERPDADLL
jgi:hypothetical protein